jgi:hypothetical protein
VPLAELMGADVEIGPAGFDIADPVIDRTLPGGRAHLVAEPSRAVLRIADVGTFAVADGRHIRFDPEEGVQPSAASPWLHGTVAALLLAQRGRFALHASVVDVDGVAVALAGPPGVGKSTTALRLAQSGHLLVTDDLSPLRCNDDVIVHPFDRPVHVFAETAEGLGLDVSRARPVLPQHPKLALPTTLRAPVRLCAVAVLRAERSAVAVEAVRVRGAPAHWLVGTNAYRARLLHELWKPELFAWAGAVAARVLVYVVTRPGAGWTVDEVARAIERIARP